MRAEFNIFVGGYMLDRGITVPNMISFYYGRRPSVMQADTVQQHFRMFGRRPPEDMLVTRLFTTPDIHERMKTIHDLDSGLRAAFDNDVNSDGVALLKGTKKNGIRFCAPNKIKLTQTLTVAPGRAAAPKNIGVKDASALNVISAAVGKLIDIKGWRGVFVALDHEKAFEIIDLASQTMTFAGQPFDWSAMKSLITYYLKVDKAPELLVTVALDRNLTRANTLGKSGLSLLGQSLRASVEAHAGKCPVLVLLRQAGSVDKGWTGAEFWWPVLYAPKTASPCVYAAKAPVTRNKSAAV
jgi:hypothetical protein